MENAHRIVKSEITNDEIQISLANGTVVHLSSRNDRIHISMSNIDGDLTVTPIASKYNTIGGFFESVASCGFEVGNSFDVLYHPKGD